MHGLTTTSRVMVLCALLPVLLRSHLVNGQGMPVPANADVAAQDTGETADTAANEPATSLPDPLEATDTATDAPEEGTTSTVGGSAPTATASALGNASGAGQPPTPNYESLMEPYYLFRQRFLGTDCPNHKSDPAFYACCHPLPQGATADPSCFYWPQDDDPCEEGDKDCYCDEDEGDVA
ncbi:hypothetical protein HD553DRAFT_350021 [Filobasidium floriforme]|uniref:uncharacterized protein n=1 Tax=Filobasidium floriforme TaxID=5210 RepID=UPI001E8E6AF8|nr:uncharacterized protein HD553DRAFT_350021 [Filobasidium floriforme]KAH8084585.1 hypothetical protein HD553DRAFT_350021 [Filobasidium floriforme]